MSAKPNQQQKRVQKLQKQLKIARDTLEAIRGGRVRDPEVAAIAALDEIGDLDVKYQLQGICGHM